MPPEISNKEDDSSIIMRKKRWKKNTYPRKDEGPDATPENCIKELV
ncbi:26892_t:CDS:2, partial [Racocetra persica]